jgi:hypothetical protein
VSVSSWSSSVPSPSLLFGRIGGFCRAVFEPEAVVPGFQDVAGHCQVNRDWCSILWDVPEGATTIQLKLVRLAVNLAKPLGYSVASRAEAWIETLDMRRVAGK